MIAKKKRENLPNMRNSIKLEGIMRKPLIQGEIMRQRISRTNLIGCDLDNFKELSKSDSKERVDVKQDMR